MISHDQIDRYRILGWLTPSNERDARAVTDKLPQRLDVACAVCEDPNCTQRAVLDLGGVW